MLPIQLQALLILEQEEEKKLLNKFVQSNPYPIDYNEMLASLPLKLDAEYGQSNHKWCKTIYENMENTKLINDIINKIAECGGQQALNANLIIILDYSPLKTSNNIFAQYYFLKYIFNIYYEDKRIKKQMKNFE